LPDLELKTDINCSLIVPLFFLILKPNTKENMQNIWTYISGFGLKSEDTYMSRKTIVLSNQLNFVMLLSMFFLLLTTVTTLLLTRDTIYYGTLRVIILFFVTLINLALSRYGYPQLSRLSLIYLPPIVFLLGPTLVGYVEEESYTYYPYTLICVSIIPQLLVHPKREKFLYWFSLVYYFILVIIIDKLMVQFGTTSFPIVDRINTFYPFYKIAHIGLFLFINASIFYLRNLNFRFEEELNRKNSELDLQNAELRAQKEEIERHKDELVSKEIYTWQKLVGIISHEIVNSAIPITNLAGVSAQMLEDETGSVQKADKIEDEVTEDIHHSLKIIESRTRGLINFVKATKSLTEMPEPNLRKISVEDLLDRISSLYKAKFREKGLAFEKVIEPPDLSLEGDLELLEQVLINLIQNAVEALGETENPFLRILASINKSGNVQISISDNGPGISDEIIERIFLPFYSTKESNSGIGLSLSQQIMMLHHGRLEVTSEKLKGATFSMIF
jgi:signal transduction histidine kinase